MEAMRDAKVEGFMPSNSAAPRTPDTFPFACVKALMMASRSWRFSSSSVEAPDGRAFRTVIYRYVQLTRLERS